MFPPAAPLWTRQEREAARRIARTVMGGTREPDDATIDAYCGIVALARNMVQQAPTAGASFTVAGAMSIAVGSRAEGVTSRLEIERTAKEYGKSCERLFKLFALAQDPMPAGPAPVPPAKA